MGLGTGHVSKQTYIYIYIYINYARKYLKKKSRSGGEQTVEGKLTWSASGLGFHTSKLNFLQNNDTKRGIRSEFRTVKQFNGPELKLCNANNYGRRPLTTVCASQPSSRPVINCSKSPTIQISFSELCSK